MSGRLHTWLLRMFPTTPDFGRLLAEECAAVRNMTDALASSLSTPGHPLDLDTFSAMEKAANALRQRNLDELNRAFSTPFDREDIYRAGDALDGIVLHAMRTVRELSALALAPDEAMIDLSGIIRQGVHALNAGFDALAGKGSNPDDHIALARDTERLARRCYEQALASLFEQDDIVEIMKRREIYHHLADGAARVRQVAGVLGDISVKNI